MTVASRGLCAALLLMATAATAETITTVSTSLLPTSEGGECEWRENAFADEDAFLCPGAGGYRVYVRDGGVESWPAFTRGRQLSDLRAGITSVIGTDIVALTGEPMEWRMVGARPAAAIFQIRADDGTGGDILAYVVARVGGDRVCVAGRAADAAAARRIADRGGGCR